MSTTAIRNVRLAALTGAATLMLAFAPPAAAAQNDQRAAAASEQDAGGSSAAPRATRAPEREICVRAQLTGSRLNRRICRTQAEWDADGGVPTGR